MRLRETMETHDGDSWDSETGVSWDGDSVRETNADNGDSWDSRDSWDYWRLMRLMRPWEHGDSERIKETNGESWDSLRLMRTDWDSERIMENSWDWETDETIETPETQREYWSLMIPMGTHETQRTGYSWDWRLMRDNGDCHETQREYNGDSWDWERLLETHETNGDSWDSDRLLEFHETHGDSSDSQRD